MGKTLSLFLYFWSSLTAASTSICAPTHYDETVVFKSVIDGDTLMSSDPAFRIPAGTGQDGWGQCLANILNVRGPSLKKAETWKQ